MKKSRMFIACAIMATAVILSPIDVSADSFKGTIEDIKETKSETAFVFSFSERQFYDITLTDPNGEIYNAASEGSEIRITVEKAVKGDYSFSISADNPDFTYSVNVVDSGKTIATVGESNPTITENVSGLNIFFEDTDLIATWSYSDKVSITIMDPKRFKYLVKDEQTSATEYRCSLPADVDQVQFYIVPVADIKVNGAGLTYTRDVVRDIDAYVEFPDIPIINKDSITIPVKVNADGLTVEMYNNDYTVGVTNHLDKSLKPLFSEAVAAGEYEVEIPLVGVENNLVACVIDRQGNAITYSYKYMRDMLAPKIEASKLSLDNTGGYLDYQTTNNTVLITGTITDEIAADVLGGVNTLFINGYTVDIDNSGRFSFEEQLNLGVNNIVIRAIDDSGNESSMEFTVEMVEEKANGFKGTGIIVAVLLLLCGGALFYSFKKGKVKAIPNTQKQIGKIKKEQKKVAEKEKATGNDGDYKNLLNSSMFDSLFSDETVQEEEYEDGTISKASDSVTEFSDDNADVEEEEELIDDCEDAYETPNPVEVSKEASQDVSVAAPIVTKSFENKISFSKEGQALIRNTKPILEQIEEEEKMETLYGDKKKSKKAQRELLKLQRRNERLGKKDEETCEPWEDSDNADCEDPLKSKFRAVEPVEEELEDEPSEVVYDDEENKYKAVAETAGINRKPSLNIVCEDIEGLAESKVTAETFSKKPSMIPSLPKNGKKNSEKKETKAKNECGKKMEKCKQRRLFFGLATAIVLLLFLQIFLGTMIQNTVVSSGSMEPTLNVGDYVIYNKLAYKKSEPQRGDIISFWCAEKEEYFGKRVIGIAGDVISFEDGFVFINGLKADESAYLDFEVETECSQTFEVPAGYVFVLGDNRTSSWDSRSFENPYVKISDIEGKYIGTIKKFWK